VEKIFVFYIYGTDDRKLQQIDNACRCRNGFVFIDNGDGIVV